MDRISDTDSDKLICMTEDMDLDTDKTSDPDMDSNMFTWQRPFDFDSDTDWDTPVRETLIITPRPRSTHYCT